MFVGMVLASFIGVSGGMQAVAMRHVRVVGRLFMTSSFMMFSRLAMMLGRVLVMIRGLMMVFRAFVCHVRVSFDWVTVNRELRVP
jgi:hypothetical protein